MYNTNYFIVDDFKENRIYHNIVILYFVADKTTEIMKTTEIDILYYRIILIYYAICSFTSELYHLRPIVVAFACSGFTGSSLEA